MSEANMMDELNGSVYDPNKTGGDSPRKLFLDEYSDIPQELDEPHPFEVIKIHARKVNKSFQGSEPKEVTEIVFTLGLLTEDGELSKDAETGKVFAIEKAVSKPKPTSYDFFKKSGLYKFFDVMKLDITEDIYQKPYKLGNFLGAKGRMLVEIVEGISKRTSKPYRVAKLQMMMSPKDKAGMDKNKALFASVFE